MNIDGSWIYGLPTPVHVSVQSMDVNTRLYADILKLNTKQVHILYRDVHVAGVKSKVEVSTTNVDSMSQGPLWAS